MSEYKMPKVYLGQTVIWYASPGGEGCTALVTKVGERAICVAALPPGYNNAMAPDGVLHVSDPNVARQLDREEGVWDYTEYDKYLHRLLEELAGGSKKTGGASSKA